MHELRLPRDPPSGGIANSDARDGVPESRQEDHARDEFLATFAHELRNPLAPMRNAVHVLRLQSALTPDSQWALDVMARQIKNMARLIDDLMDVARVGRNTLELHRTQLEFADVARLAIETSLPLIEANGHALIQTLPREPVYVRADRMRLAQALSNILNNAAKFTPTGGRIALAAEVQGDWLAIAIRDNGIGIDAALLPRIFEMFSCGTQPSERMVGGLGIGLTLVKRLVELHGGTVHANSAGVGRGSEFVIRLQVLKRPLAAEPAPVFHAAPAAPRRILVVDDHKDTADSLCVLLQANGNSVYTASDGEAALEAAFRFRPDVVLLDIGLPKKNGYEVARTIRQQQWGKETLLVAITGWGQESDETRAADAGFDRHLIKPIDPDALHDLLVI